MDFQGGLNMFIDVTELNTLDVREDDFRARFRDAILDKNHGLCCILFKHINWHQYIILDNDEFDMVPFLQEIIMIKWYKSIKSKAKVYRFSKWIETYQFLEKPTGNAFSRDSNYLNSEAFQELRTLDPHQALPWTYWKAYSAPGPPAAICNDQLHHCAFGTIFHIRNKDFFSLWSIRDTNIFHMLSIRDKDLFALPFDRFPVPYPP